MGALSASQAAARANNLAIFSTTVDREITRSLANQAVDRLAFAKNFTTTVILNSRPRVAPSPVLARRPEPPLSSKARNVAAEFGLALAKADPLYAAYMAGIVYTSALPETYRATHGVFYTPPELAERLIAMAEDSAIDWAKVRVLDPACGGGAFLVPIALRMAAALSEADPAFVLQQIAARLHGFELDPFGAWLAQTALDLALHDHAVAARRPVPKIVDVRDSLDLKAADAGRFDLVVGNPPYRRATLAPNRRTLFKRGVYGHANLYGLFTDAALRWTKVGGLIAFVTPTSMLSGLYYKALRRLLGEESPPRCFKFVSERSGVFADALQETMLATYQRGGSRTAPAKVGFISVGSSGKATLENGGAFELPTHREAPWLLPRRIDEVPLARRLRSMMHRLSDYGYAVSTGPLVWNRHKTQLGNKHSVNAYPIIWAESITRDGRFVWRSQKRNHAPWLNAILPKDRWLIVTEPCVLVQRTTAKEQTRRLIAAEMPRSFVEKHKGVAVENHLNMVRALARTASAPPSVIAALLNCAVVDSAFRCINGSVAVSAFELEELPLPPPEMMAKLAALVRSGASATAIETVIAAAYLGDDAAVFA